MNNLPSTNVLIMDEVTSIRNRLKTILENLNISVYEASNPLELFKVMADLHNCPDTVIMDIGNDTEKGFEVLAKIRAKNQRIPIIILTSNSKRHIFTRGIVEGASDYILKPFRDDVIIERVLRCLRKSNENEIEVLFDIHSYLNTELKKALKGKYEVTVMMCALFLPVEDVNIQIEENYLSQLDYIYSNMKKVLWETDIFVKYNSRSFIGVFPFCGLESSTILRNKFVEKFTEIKAENLFLAKYQLLISTVSFPSDSADAQEVLTILNETIKKSVLLNHFRNS
ncbi:MAG: response regulator [Desulfosporosinus sp.]|nr:response regulator [Desulfosporosinus sp.]